MRQASRQTVLRLSLLYCVVGGVATTVCVGLLLQNWIEWRHETLAADLADQAPAADAKSAPVKIPPSREELDRRTADSLAHQERGDAAAEFLVVAVVLLIVGAKWRLSLSDDRTPTPQIIQLKREIGNTRAHKSARTPRNGRAAPTPLDQATAAPDPGLVDEIIERIGHKQHSAIPLLQAIQTEFRYLPEPVLQRVCESTEITTAQLMGVASFYPQFRHEPAGEHTIRVCQGTACHVAGASLIDQEMRRFLGIAPDHDTDPQRRFTVESVACLGCCTRAPVVQIDERTYGPLAIDEIAEVLEQVQSVGTNGKGRRAAAGVGRDAWEGNDAPCEIRVGLGSCCVAGGSGRVFEAVENAIAEIGGFAKVKRVGCVGMCHQTPLVEVVAGNGHSALYAGVGPDDADAIVRRHVRARGWKPRLRSLVKRGRDLWADQGGNSLAERLTIHEEDPPVAAFIGPQKTIATEHHGILDPCDIDEYRRHAGFAALRRCLEDCKPEEVIDTIADSGLRGRGGAGFPVAAKWRRVRQSDGSETFVVANGDEGDPGAFMDRMLMESFPFRILEGLAIAAYAVGAREGVLYIRAEYPLAVERIRDAIQQCERQGFLGKGICGSDFNLSLSVFEGAGAFVCGEETALIASIEGRRGMPRWRPPYPAQRGLEDRPTLVNNVETLANLPWIIRNGPEAFATLGTPRSKGTKVFALAGKIERGGLIEVPMGTTIREIVEDIGGGVKNGGKLKAVQIGGPSGGCIPAALADTPVDFEALTEVGAIMGSGGLVVMDEGDCMVDIARYFLSFTQNQSCGRCTHCRIGTRRMLELLEKLCEGRGKREDLDRIEALAGSVQAGSLCGLGRTAPNPVVTTLRYFREEYEAHLNGECPAGKCAALIGYHVTETCTGCTLCSQHCPADAIPFRPYERHEIDLSLCTRCDICRTTCPEHAIEVMTTCRA